MKRYLGSNSQGSTWEAARGVLHLLQIGGNSPHGHLFVGLCGQRVGYLIAEDKLPEYRVKEPRLCKRCRAKETS